MKQTWRWFGPPDRCTIDEILQCGAEGVVSALHHVPPGTAWTPDEIGRRQREIATRADGTPSGLTWDVVESLPVSEAVKLRTGPYQAHLAAWCDSLTALAAAGIGVVCYNFMPLLDWTRTALAHPLPRGGTCMRYDHLDFAVFDIDVLRRPGAADDYPAALHPEIDRRRAETSRTRRDRIAHAVLSGLPGESQAHDPATLVEKLARYRDLTDAGLRDNMRAFLEEVVPVAEGLGLRLCCHPDDPPFPLMGLPRVMSTEDDFRAITDAVRSPANGITLCSGSLGARGDADLPGFMRRLGDRVHFLHLRNVRRETDALIGSFHESEHLDGETDMVALIAEILAEEARRRDAGRDDAVIPMRPDHGHDLLADLDRRGQPGYPLIGRMRGLAELRGVTLALAAAQRAR